MTRDNPNCYLRRATPEEILQSWHLNYEEWGMPVGLTREQYFQREIHLDSQELTKDGGKTFWVLARKSLDSSENNGRLNTDEEMLCICGTIRKPALVKYADGRVEEVTSYGIGDVFCPPEKRGKGYAGVMLRLLAERLRALKMPSGNKWEVVKSPFSVLYSDIGKKFYARLGWHAFPAFHASLTAIPIPKTEAIPFTASELPQLCKLDIEHLTSSFSNTPVPDGRIAKVAFIPTVEVMGWLHAREEFICKHRQGKVPEVKGVKSKNGRQWIVWTRYWKDQKLKILRFVDLDIKDSASSMSAQTRANIEQLLMAARNEAYEWDLEGVEIWNPNAELTEIFEDMVRREGQGQSSIVVEREEKAIPSLRWNDDPGAPARGEIAWEENEMFAWC